MKKGMSKVAVFHERELVYTTWLHGVDPLIIKSRLDDVEIASRLINAEELADTNYFNKEEFPILIHIYGAAYPQRALDALVKFRQAGGCIVTTGAPFTEAKRKMPRTNTVWEKADEKRKDHHFLGFPNFGTVWEAEELRYAPNKGDPLDLDFCRWGPSYAGGVPWEVVEEKSLPPEDDLKCLVACVKGTQLLGYPVVLIEHCCAQFRGAIDFIAGSTIRTVLPRPTIEQAVIVATGYILERKGMLSEGDYQKVREKVRNFTSPFKKTYVLSEEKKKFSGIFPQTKNPEKNLLVLKENPKDFSERLLVTCLQGLVNREKPRIYIGEDLPLSWLKVEGYRKTMVKDAFLLIEKFKKYVKGLVIYDPDQPASINVALTLCGIEDALAVSPSLAKKLNFPIIENLIGKWDSDYQAYKWAFEYLWPKCNHHLICHLRQGAKDDHIGLNGMLVDYLVAFKIFSFHLDCQPTDEEITLISDILASMPQQSAVIGMFHWNKTYTEAEVTCLASELGKLVIATYNMNLTVHSGIPISKQLFVQKKLKRPRLNPDKCYISFIFTDGDNLGYLLGGTQQEERGNHFYSRKWWEDPNRGKVPLGWTIGPSVIDLAPDILAHYYRTATENDYFVVTFGAGYIFGDVYGIRCAKSGKKVRKGFCSLTDEYMRRTDTELLHPHHIAITLKSYKMYAKNISNLKGIFADYSGYPRNYKGSNYMLKGDIPVFHALTFVPSQPGDPVDFLVKKFKSITDERPAFIHASLINWYYTPSVVAEVMKKLGKEYVAVRPDHVVELYLAASEFERRNKK